MGQKVIPDHATMLVDLLRWDGPRMGRAELAALSPDGWASLVALAETQRVAVLLRARLDERGLLALAPGAIAERLVRLQRANAMRNLLIYRDLAQIAASAAALGIPLVALKGVALAAPLYGNLALRIIGDIDLLVPEARLAALGAALADAGYKPALSHKISRAMPLHLSSLEKHLPPLQREGSPFLVELHGRLSTAGDSCTIPVDEVWARLEPLELPGSRLHGLGAEDLLLHLCIHATHQHRLIDMGLRPLCDIAQVLMARGDRLRWPEVLERSARWRCRRGLALALRLAHDLVGAPVPVEVLDDCGASAIHGPLLDTTRAEIFSQSRMSTDLARLSASSGLWSQASVLWRRIFVSRERLALEFQLSPRDPRLPLYYLLRFAALLRRHTETAVAMARGDEQAHRLAARRLTIEGWLAGD